MARFSRAVAVVKVETHWYLSAYPQVREEIADGKAANPLDHYLKIGMYRGFLPIAPDFDEAWYIAQNPDVAAAIKAGRFRIPVEHYVFFGAREGRAPSPAFATARKNEMLRQLERPQQSFNRKRREKA